MRNTTIKTSVTYSIITAMVFNTTSKEVFNKWTETIPATAKTEKGYEKLLQDFLGDDFKILDIENVEKVQKWYEMDRETFLKNAKEVTK